jgi:hypothetical protein
MRKQRWYEITNMEEFVSSLRIIILDSFYENEFKNAAISNFTNLIKTKKDDIEKSLTIQETHSIIKPMLKKIKTKGAEEYNISRKDFKKTLNDLNKRVVSNILISLAAEGLIESGFDEEKNDFIFWMKE